MERKQEEILRLFDPFSDDSFRVSLSKYDDETLEMVDGEKESGEEKGRRYVRWRYSRLLNRSVAPRAMNNIEERVKVAYYLRYSYSYLLTYFDGEKMYVQEFWKNVRDAPFIRENYEAEKYLEEQEQQRLEMVGVERPNTKWKFLRFHKVDVKVILTRSPLLGTGLLPDWLRNLAHGRAMVSLDTFNDNLCLWRCIAVHKGARVDRCTKKAREMAKGYYKLSATQTDAPTTSLDELDRVERFLNKGLHTSSWMGIRVYVPQRNRDGEITWLLERNPAACIKNIVTIGAHAGHAFLIKDIKKLGRHYQCAHCSQRFTQACSLQRHNQTCKRGETTMVYPQLSELPTTAYQRAMYPKSTASKQSMLWLEQEAKRRGIHIHHARCGHGGERWLPNGKGNNKAPVDGYNHETRTVFQYHGCRYHGCPKCFPDLRDHILLDVGGEKPSTPEELYQETVKQTTFLRRQGFNVVEAWGCEVGLLRGQLSPMETRTYPHAIFWDTETFGDKNYRKEPTELLTIENVQIPISISLGDTLEREPTHLCERKPEELIRKFMKELERRANNIRKTVRAEVLPADMYLLSKAQKEKMNEWCNQVPVLGFNSGSFDLNVIEKYFVDNLTEVSPKPKVGAKGNKKIFILTPEFRFLDIINYVGPGTSYDKWIKAYGCKTEKSWFPYEWFDTPEKLDYPGLPDYEEWYSKLKACHLLTREQWEDCNRVYRERGMESFADWLRYYNNLDVTPGLEALEKMRNFFTEKRIDIFKDAVSISGVSLNYLLTGTIERGQHLYSPGKEEYEMLKGAIVGGPSLVFTRKHVVGETQIRSHQVAEPRLCKKILGYDANALYLSTMNRDMPCGRGRVVHHESSRQEAEAYFLSRRVKEEKVFGFVEVDIHVPKGLWGVFEEMCPFFYNKAIPDECVPQSMKDYLRETGRGKRSAKDRKLVGALSAEKILLYTPLLKWYLDHGMRVTRVYREIHYKRAKPFQWFVEEVTEARRMGDKDKDKALLADIFKLLGNSAYGKTIEDVTRQTNIIYTKDENVVDRALRSAFFEDLEEIGPAYKLESRKPRVMIKRPFQVGIAVYQSAKLRMLEFYYDFLDKYIDRKDFDLIQMDTDSLYMGISGERLEDLVRPELKAEFEAEKKEWLSWDKWSSRKPGLFKLEFEGARMIALCSKNYYCDVGRKKKKKRR